MCSHWHSSFGSPLKNGARSASSEYRSKPTAWAYLNPWAGSLIGSDLAAERSTAAPDLPPSLTFIVKVLRVRMIGPLVVCAKRSCPRGRGGACCGRRVTAQRGALHFHDSSIFAVLFFRHRPLLQFRGLGHARLGPVSVRKAPWFPGEYRAFRRAVADAEKASFAASFRVERDARVLLAMQKVVGSNPISRFRKGLYLQVFFVGAVA
jgi:hypothetical protein